MAQWRLERGGTTTVTTEEQVREELRSGRLSGAELVRPPGATGWLPLHTLAVFAEEVPVRRNDRRARDARIARGWVAHAVFFSVMLVWAGRGTIPIWAFFWGIALLAHTTQGLPAALRTLRGARRPTVRDRRVKTPPTPTDKPATTHEPEPQPAASEFLTQVTDAVEAVQSVWSRGTRALGPLPDLDGLTRAAEQLETRHQALIALHLQEDRATLEAELEAATGRATQAADAVTAEVYAEEAEAIRERLAGIDAAVSVADQLAARKRTLLHQLAGLRLAAGQTAATHDGTEPARVAGTLVEKTATLRDALQASAEVDEALVRARQAAVAARKPIPS